MHQPADRRAANHTRLPGTVIDQQPFVIVGRRSGGAAEIEQPVAGTASKTQRQRAAVGNGFGEDGANGLPKALDFVGAQPASRAAGRKPGAEEAFAGVDVADAADELLVEVFDFDRLRRAAERGGELRRREFVAERLRTEPGEGGRVERHATKGARILEDQTAWP